MEYILEKVNQIVWGIPALLMILGVGIHLTFQTGFAQIRLFPASVKSFLRKLRTGESAQDESSFKALCTALAATVGTGNIAGVAGAIAIGGPGSIFWMWICAFLGMVTKYTEAVLSVSYRKKQSDGSAIGGPMYMIEMGMGKKWRWLGVCYSIFGVVAAFGMGNATQINAFVSSIHSVQSYFSMDDSQRIDLIIGAFLALLVAVSLLGGGKRIGNIASVLVPVAAAAYLVLGIGAILLNAQRIPLALYAIVKGAFAPRAVTGGVIGSAMISLRVGASRGVFTNEAGMGTAAIAHGEALVSDPKEQGMMGIMEVFLDTVVICTVTALVILTSETEILYGMDEGAALTTRAFACTYGPWVSIPMSLFLGAFAFATMLGWGLYGLRCAQYLFGDRSYKVFILLQAVAAVSSVLLKTGTVWLMSEIVNGLMAIPNLTALLFLSSKLRKNQGVRRHPGIIKA